MKENKHKKDLDKEKIISETKFKKDSKVVNDINEKDTENKNNADSLKEEIINLKQQNKNLKEQLLRNQAESENFKKRLQQEFENSKQFALQKLIQQILPSLDCFDRALHHACENDQIEKFIKGFEMVKDGIYNSLKEAGVTKIKALGEKFNPYLHESISEGSDKTKENDVILEELVPGYKLNDRVIRASVVKINKIGGQDNE